MTNKQGQKINNMFADILAPNAVSVEVDKKFKSTVYEPENKITKTKNKKLNDSFLDILSSSKVKGL